MIGAVYNKMAARSEASSISMSMKAVLFGIRKSFPQVNHIDTKQFRQIKEREDNVLCLDARAQEEYDISHIPDSIRVDYNKEEPWNGIDFTNTKKVVCYCSVGYRSSVVADKLSRHLKEQNIDVYNLEGGVFQWAIENNELNGQSTNQVHPYSSLWGKLLPVNLRYKPPDSNL